VIKLNNVSKKFGDHVIFDNYCLEISKGDFVAITGPSGKGKTTLLNMIGLLEKHDSGCITVNGHNNPKFGSREGILLLRNEISYIFQNFGLIENKTVYYNMAIASRFSGLGSGQERKKIAEALEQVGIAGFEKKKVYQLSGGEQQRVALAKILVKPSSIILADEPTGSLDAKNRDQVLSMLQDFNKKGKTVVVVTHDPCVEACASRIVKL